jgi:hypothetical protein
MRAFFANGVDKMHVPWAVEGLPTLLHLSLFLFLGGLVIFLFNVDQEVFTCVVLWIGLFSMVYGLITLLPLIRQDSPYYAPLSLPTWFLYTGIQYLTFKVLTSIASDGYFLTQIRRRLKRCRKLMSGGVEKAAGKLASKPSLEIDLRILGWTISALGDDDSLEKFFEAIPGFFNSKLVNDLQNNFPDDFSRGLSNALGGFLGRTWSSNSVVNSVKLRRLDMSLGVISLIRVSEVSSILDKILFKYWHQVPQTVEMGHILARWCVGKDQRTTRYAQRIVTRVLATAPERDDRWVKLATRIFGLPEQGLRDYIAHGGDNVLLSILIQIGCRFIRSDSAVLDRLSGFEKHQERHSIWDVLLSDFEVRSVEDIFNSLSKFDIRNTLPELQHDFCTLWNEIPLKSEGDDLQVFTEILLSIHHSFMALHPYHPFLPDDGLSGNVFSPCDIASHRPLEGSAAHACVSYCRANSYPTIPCALRDTYPHGTTAGPDTVQRQITETSFIAGPPSPSVPKTPSETRDSSQAPAATEPALPVYLSPHATGASPPSAVAAVLHDIPSHYLDGTTQRFVYPKSHIRGILSARPTPPPASSLISTSNSLTPTSSIIGTSMPASPPPSLVPPLPNAESLALLSSTTPSCPAGNAILPCLRVRGLVNTGSICSVNAVLQLLVHSPPFWNLFREMDNLKSQRGAGGLETCGGATPLVDATVRFLEEFMPEEKRPPPMKKQLQPAARGRTREDEEEKGGSKVIDAFEPTYLYEAMKEKRQLKILLARFRAT